MLKNVEVAKSYSVVTELLLGAKNKREATLRTQQDHNKVRARLGRVQAQGHGKITVRLWVSSRVHLFTF